MTLSLGATAVHADPALEECSIAGPDAFFCSGKTFRQMKLDVGEGVTFWLHKTGFLSKVLVEDTQFLLKDNQLKVLKLEIINEQINLLLREEINERILNNGKSSLERSFCRGKLNEKS